MLFFSEYLATQMALRVLENAEGWVLQEGVIALAQGAMRDIKKCSP